LSSAITFLIDARISSIEGSRPEAIIYGDIAYCLVGVTPCVVGCVVTGGVTGVPACSAGVTVRVETGAITLSPAQSFQLPATRR
jgi:hypothetical protein